MKMNGKILIVEDEFIIAEDLRKILEKAGYEISGIAPSVPKALEIIKLKRPAWVFVDIQLTGKLTGLDLAASLNEMEIPFIYVSANSNQGVLELAKATKPYGFMVKPFREKDVLVALDIAIYRHENNLESKLVKEVALQGEVLQILESRNDWQTKIMAILASFHNHIPFDYFAVCWDDENRGNNGMAYLKEDGDIFQFLSIEQLASRIGKTREDLLTAKSKGIVPKDAIFYGGPDFEQMLDQNPFRKLISREFELGSILLQPVSLPVSGKLLFSFYNRDGKAYKQEHVAWLERLQLLLIQIGDKLLSHQQSPEIPNPMIADPREAVEEPVIEIIDRSEELGLVGSSEAFDKIKEQLKVVAPFDISVLILGESGTGKERVAQAIHRISDRRTKPLVKVNCGAIPAALMESELFGHEKGAFTSAVNRRIGKFEEAIGGTIFLDEIGELPLDLQVKLLCVLQEKEIVRVGGSQVIKTDVRVIAATNRNLEKEVAEGRFRLDLYYRLNVFPLTLPPLRRRKEDIAALSAYFLKALSKKMGKTVTSMSEQVGYALQAYEWPGNIRELENILERGILLSAGSVLTHVDLPEKTLQDAAAAGGGEQGVKTYKEMEKEYIFSVLKKCGGRIGGPGGAAEMLDLAPTTLISKMNKLGIVKKFTT
ncbi:sigma 54-interacting response regulator [Mucilaginibacter celer]|uniref:Response regulator n=1 Tax=Mucilaginibacter celer TaxID=2305508 RepID=A0A494VHR9_9SPHI|nr:sigma 54-interacting response regulator [Mucilaginibacter celer]AYL94317.1 response regulator [Mucilaginibacter celer]